MNLEPNFEFMLQIKRMPNFLHRHTVSFMRLKWSIYWSKLVKIGLELENLICTGPKKDHILQFFSSMYKINKTGVGLVEFSFLLKYPKC